ncbi:MAG: Pr6Pr family membrane protein [Luteimonas sp.]
MLVRSSASILRPAFGLLALSAIARQLALHVQLGFDAVNFFSFFTNLSNLFAAAVLIACARGRSSRSDTPNSIDRLRAVSVVNMSVVGLVFAILLRETDLGSLLPWVNVVLHYVMPCVVVLDWLLQPPRTKLGSRHLLLFQLFPAIYLAYVLVRGSTTGWYPYPFLDPANVGGYGGVAAYATAIAATFLVSGWALLALGNKLRRPGLRLSPST